MTDTTPDPEIVERVIEQSKSEDLTERRKAAKEIAVIAHDHPEIVGDSSMDLLNVLTHSEDHDVRISVSNALFQVSVGAAETMCHHPHIPIACAEILRNAAEGIRMNLARPLAEIAVRNPGLVWEAAGQVVPHLEDSSDSVRHSIAWAIEQLTIQGHRVPGESDVVVPAFPDGHDPVDKHLCRTIAALERFGVDHDVDPETVATILERDSERTRAAATILLGAMGSREARNYLFEARSGDPSATVRRQAECALREATLPEAVPETALESIDVREGSELGAALEDGEWISVDPVRAPAPRGNRYRGKVIHTVDDPRECDRVSVGDSPATLARAWNPYEEYCIHLGTVDDEVFAAVDDERMTHGPQFPVGEVQRIAEGDDLLPLLYALEGDELAFAVEGVPHEARVESVDPTDGIVRASNDDKGVAVEFRPTSRRPRRVDFEAGRGFEATNIALGDVDRRDYDEVELADDPWAYPRWRDW